MRRLVAGALLVVGLLVGQGRGLTPPVVRAAPPPETDPTFCVPQPVSGAQAQLVGSLRLLDLSKPPMTGQQTQIIMQGAAIRLPDPTCEGRYVTWSTLSPRWSVVSRPAGSTATPTVAGANTAALVPDRGGAWRLAFTACPAGCRIAGVTVPAQTRELSFTVLTVREGRVSDLELENTLTFLAGGTRLQISQTGAGTTVGGAPAGYTLGWTIPSSKYHEECEAKQPPAPICAQWEEGRTGQTTFHTFTPRLSSYIDFGPDAESAGAPDYLPLPIDVVEKDLSTATRAVILTLQNPVIAIDVDRIRILANNLNVDLTYKENRSWSIGGGAINLGVKFRSDDPSIKCEGHFKAKALYAVTLSEGWADELCPDFNLSRMELTVKLIPAVLDGLLTVGDAQVTALLEPEGFSSAVIDFFRNVTGRAATQIETKLRAKLLEDQTRRDLGEVLTAALKKKYPDLCRVVSAEVIGTDLVVHYQAPLTAAVGCGTDGGVVAPTPAGPVANP